MPIVAKDSTVQPQKTAARRVDKPSREGFNPVVRGWIYTGCRVVSMSVAQPVYGSGCVNSFISENGFEPTPATEGIRESTREENTVR